MANIITIHDDIRDIDTKINLDDNRNIQLSAMDYDLLRVVADEIAEQLVELKNCAIYYLSGSDIFYFERDNCFPINDYVNWMRSLKANSKKYDNIVLFVEKFDDIDKTYYKKEISYFDEELYVNIEKLISAKSRTKITFFNFYAHPYPEYCGSTLLYLYGSDYLTGIKYLDNPFLKSFSMDCTTKGNESLLRQQARYFLACREVYQRLSTDGLLYLTDEETGILRDKNFCHSDVDHIVVKLYKIEPTMKYYDIEKLFVYSDKKKFKSAMQEFLSFTMFSEVAKSIIIDEDNVSGLLENGEQFKEFDCFRYPYFWDKVKSETLLAIYSNSKEKQDFIKQCANQVLHTDASAKVADFLALLENGSC